MEAQVNTARRIELGQPSPLRVGRGDRRGQELCLETRDAVLRVEHRDQNTWVCEVIAQLTPGGERRVTIDADQLAQASTWIAADPDTEPDRYALLLWPTRVFQLWRISRLHPIARQIAEEMRTPGTLQVDLGPEALDRLANSHHLHSVALRLLLDQLIDARLLIPAQPGPIAGWGGHTLSLPDQDP